MKNKPKDCNSIRLNNCTTYCCTLIYNNHAIITFKKLLLDFKMKKAAELLKTTNKSITMISSELGYVYASYFIKVFKNYFGVTPKQFLKKFTC
uniref:Putative AraC-family transcriptional regulator n=2 Tax=Escherichia coli TaxID=562 RepID=A0A7U1E1A6_ECOLX|nr:putative AraC-family transcriptional regulator [Escherichia coli]